VSHLQCKPHISEAQLPLHHDKHHIAYVNGANAILEKLDKARHAGTNIDMKAALKELSFQAGGHVLHSLTWVEPVSCLEDRQGAEWRSG
jgi:Fe-Mn family superoxide dismutase